MLTFVPLMLCACALILILVRRRRTSSVHIVLPPSLPRAWPIIGHLHLLAMQQEPLQRYLHKLAGSHGTLFSLQLGGVSVVVVSSPQSAKEFLHTHERSFAQRPKNEVGRRALFNHKTTLTMGCGAEWRSLRKLYTVSVLSRKQIAAYEGMRHAEMVEQLKEVGRRAERGVAVELGKEIYIVVGNMMTRVLFSRRLFTEEAGSAYREMLEEVAKQLGLPLMGDLVPWLFWLDHVCGRVRKLDALTSQFNSLMHAVLAPRLMVPATSSTSGAPSCASPAPPPPPSGAPALDYLHLLLQLYNDDGSAGIDSIKGILADFMLGGIDSTSTTIKWAMAELLMNPPCMARLQKEMDTLMGAAHLSSTLLQSSQSQASEQQRLAVVIGDTEVARMSYLHAVVKETLRLHPPFPLIIRQLVTCSDHGLQRPAEAVGMYKLPNNTSLVYNAWAVARDPQLWGEDAHEFCPDRFLRSPAPPQAHGQHLEYVPFGMGSRGCPGRDMAFTVVPFVVANLVYRFDWSLPPARDQPLDLSDELPGVPSRLADPLVALPTLRSPALQSQA